MALLASRNLSQTKSNAISRLFEWDKTKTFCYNEINERNFQFAMQMSRTTNVVERDRFQQKEAARANCIVAGL